MVAVSSLSSFISSIFPSKSPSPTLVSLPVQQLQLPKTTHFQHNPLVATENADSAPASFLSLTTTGDTDIFPVVCPSRAYAKVLYFKSGFNVQINVEDDEPEDRILLRFRRAVMRAGILQECRRRKFFENSHDKKKRKARDSAKRNRKRRPQKQAQDRKEPPKKKDEDEDDNWELPEGDLPYC